MDALDLTGLLVLGFVAGAAGGLLGVGGGVVFVPALVVFAHLSQLEAPQAFNRAVSDFLVDAGAAATGGARSR